MNRWSGSQVSVAFLLASTVGFASACSSQSAPASGARAPTATAVPAPSASIIAPTLPVLTPTGVVSSTPPDVAPPAAPAATNVKQPAAAGQMCGGFAGIRCADKLYCSFALDAKCGAGDMSGTCKAIPDMCTMEFAPVCGCDGKTYSTACIAARSGVSAAKGGACPGDSGSGIAEGKPCGTRGASGDCSEGLYCAYKSQCGATDAGGKCTKKPEVCPHLVAPVCGCDSKTYDNSCEAARGGVSVSAPGACKTK